MHPIKTLLLTSLLLACGGGQSASRPDIAQTSSGSPDVAVSSPSSPGVSCAQEIALDCPNGVDGCTTGKTTVHVCVSQTAQAGPSCSQEVALECPDGEIDACLVTPPAAANHICVRR
jgi:hypothetical protein